MKKILAIILLVALVVCFAACTEDPASTVEIPNRVKPKLATPTNMWYTLAGVIKWNPVEGAEGYTVAINGKKYDTKTNSYEYPADKSFNCRVTAYAAGHEDSDAISKNFTPYLEDKPTPPVVDEGDIVIGIEGGSQVNSNGTLTLTANVSGTDDTGVVWSITNGGDYATISEEGVLTAKEVSGDKTVVVKAVSKADKTVSATKMINIRAKTTLTQDMLDEIANQDVIGFDGYLAIEVYTLGSKPELYMTYTTGVKTALDGTYWYAEYESDGIKQNVFYKNNDGIASNVAVSLMNEEEYYDMLDESGSPVSWTDSGLYNNFEGLSVTDFSWNDDEWCWKYNGHDDLPQRMISSANPYDFVPVDLSLIIEGDQIIGINSKGEDDYGIVSGYRSEQELTVAIDFGDKVEVKKINKYATYDWHEDLRTAIDNMRALDNYTLNYKNIQGSAYTSGYTQDGFVEYVTADECLFLPYNVVYDNRGNEIEEKDGDAYGFKKIREDLFNAYYQSADSIGNVYYQASRAYQKSFDSAKPTFAFAPEIFTAYTDDEEKGERTYFVDDLMYSVANTLYYGLGNDIQMYGIFATRGYVTENSSFTPYVTVKDGYIIDAGFYYYLGYLYGVVELKYYDYDTTTRPVEPVVEFDTRELPSSWQDLTIIRNDISNSTGDEEEINANDFFLEFFENRGANDTERQAVVDALPFFGVADCLGDSYGFGMTTFQRVDGITYKAVTLYYDVPLDMNYTLDSSLAKIDTYLVSLGYVKNVATGVYSKDGICVLPSDAGMDLTLLLWDGNNPA